MFPGDTKISDGATPQSEFSLKQIFSISGTGWPIMGWDVDGHFWIEIGTATEVKKKVGKFQIYEFKTGVTNPTVPDFAQWRSTADHELLCADGVFRTAAECYAKKIPVQHVRGNGHKVLIESMVKVDEVSEVFCFEVEKLGCFIHEKIIHRAGR